MGQAVLGSRDFMEQLTKRVRGTRAEPFARKKLARRPTFGPVIAVLEKLKAAPWNTFRDQHKDWGRDLAVYLGRRRCGLTLRQLAKAINGASAGAVSVAARRFRRCLETDRRLRGAGRRGRILFVECSKLTPNRKFLKRRLRFAPWRPSGRSPI